MSTKLKIIITGLLVVGIASIALLVFNKTEERSYYKTEVEYVTDVNEEVTLLEEEMAKLEFEVKAGTMTSEKATLAKVSIIARVQSIKANAQVAKGVALTPVMRVALSDALGRLANVLITYRDSLVKVEVLAREDEKTNISGGKNIPRELDDDLFLIISEVINEITVIADEDYVGGDEIIGENPSTEIEFNGEDDVMVEEASKDENILPVEPQIIDEGGVMVEDKEVE